MHRPTKQHLGAAKGVFCYVSWTVGFGICYSKDVDFSLTVYIDSDWARYVDNRKSTSKDVFN